MKKQICILGSTGSIGTQALDVIEQHPDLYEVYCLTANNRVMELAQQARKFHPAAVVIANEDKYGELCALLDDQPDIKVYAGRDALNQIVEAEPIDMVLTAMVGFAGLTPTIHAIKSGKKICLANKETLVVAGELICNLAQQYHTPILPVDSEHSAIFQSIVGEGNNEIERILLTCSGGPFRTFTDQQLCSVTAADALKHPTWAMGAKITIDSASLMNKGFEVIEAKWLFGVPADKIQVLIHPQSIVHSMVELVDGTVIAQLGVPDMGLPIQLAMTYPERKASPFAHLDFYAMKDMTFEAPDYEKTPCLKLAMDCARIGGTAPCIMSAANEVAVAMFLNHRLGYNQIYDCALQAVESIEIVNKPDLEAVLAADEQARVFVREHFS